MYGDSAVIRKRAAQLREQGLDLSGLADRLVAQSEAVPWRGRAAEAMRRRIKERAVHLRAAAIEHERAADALLKHASATEELRDAIEVREHRAQGLLEEARTRAAGEEAPVSPELALDDPVLLAFDPPPPGHRDWLDVELPGL